VEYGTRFVVEVFMGLVRNRFVACVGVLDGVVVATIRLPRQRRLYLVNYGIRTESLITNFTRHTINSVLLTPLIRLQEAVTDLLDAHASILMRVGFNNQHMPLDQT
jgi:hypothetical protein